MIIDHTNPAYVKKWRSIGANKYNGAYYYSQEIVRNIIPNVETDRNWITVNVPYLGRDHSIVFVHNNNKPDNYEWLKTAGYKDLILVCGIPETVEKVKHIGKAVYLPLSIDVAEVESYKVEEKTKSVAYFGRPAKRKDIELPAGIDIIEGVPRPEYLELMAQYESVYAVGRTAIEARALGCKLKIFDPRFKSAARWKILDNFEAAIKLQHILDDIDGK